VPTARVNGIGIYHEIHGEGEPIVLLPGLGSGVVTYGRVIAELSKAARVVAIDNRGAGRSDKPDAPYTIEMMADDAAELLGALGIGPAHILGHSLGGRIALSLALTHPEQVKSLILISTSAKVPPGRRTGLQVLGAFWRRNPVLQRFDNDPQPYYAFLRQSEASRNFDCTSRLREVHAPTLILHGNRDRIAPLALAEEMHTGIPHSKMVTYPGGHLMLFMRPGPCIRDVVDFVRTV
jgi:pimeloyl-ACP methyl ester carboxylesterase